MRKVYLLTLIFLFLTLYSYAEKIEREFTTSSGRTLSIDLASGGDISIEGWNEDKILVKVGYRGVKDADFVDYRLSNGDLDISINFSEDDIDRIHFKIRVPIKFNIELETMGGDVTIIDVEGDFSGKTMGGDLEFSKLKGEINMTTMGGDISLEDAEIEGQLKTMGGDVDFNNVVGNIKGSSMGGDVTYNNVTQGDINDKRSKVEISTMGGDIEVSDANAGVEASTMGGDIEIKNAKKFVKVKTMGGDIELGAVDGWIKASTMGGDIEAVMVGNPDEGERGVSLSSMGGDIELTLPDGLSIDFAIQLTYTKNSSRKYKIISDFPMQIKESSDWKYKKGNPSKVIRGTGEVNGGKHSIRINTTNGNITIKKK